MKLPCLTAGLCAAEPSLQIFINDDKLEKAPGTN
jgi:hypothetical protein